MAENKKSVYDLVGARKSQIPDEESLKYLAEMHNYDLSGAREAGIPDEESLSHLANIAPPKAEVYEKESPEFFGLLGGSIGSVGAAGDIVFSKGRQIFREGEKTFGWGADTKPKVKPKTFQSPSAVAERAIQLRGAPGQAGVPGAVENYGRSQFVSPEGKSVFYGAGDTGDYSGARKAAERAIETEKMYPGMKVLQGQAPIAIPQTAATQIEAQRAEAARLKDIANQQEVNKVAQLRAQRLGEREQLKGLESRGNTLKGSQKVGTKVGAPIIGGYQAGAQGAQAYNRLSRDDLEASDIASGGVNVVGSGLGAYSMAPGAKFRLPLALGSAGLNYIADFFDKRDPRKEKSVMDQQSEVPGMANGGSVTSPKLKSLSDFLDQLMQQAAAPAPAPAPMAPPQGGMPPQQQPPMQQSPLNAAMPQMAAGGLVHLAKGKLVKKLSEVLVPREGQTIIGTMADRTKATEGFSGGPGFINLHPEYTWAMDAPGAANRLLNVVNAAGGPERTVIAPMLMSKTAHKSNRPVFEKIYKELQEDIRSGKVTPQQVEALNKRLAAEKGLEASPGIDSKDFLEFANAFHRRGSVADIFGKKRIGAVDLQRHLDETIDPALRESELGAIGPQLFTAESQLLRPDVHPGYRYVISGEKGADQFTPVPREFLFRDLESKAMKELGRPLSDYNYRTSVGVPSQRIDEKLIRSLEELGYKKGGLV